eukprot:2113647-Rhodomonas_salina.4
MRRGHRCARSAMPGIETEYGGARKRLFPHTRPQQSLDNLYVQVQSAAPRVDLNLETSHVHIGKSPGVLALVFSLRGMCTSEPTRAVLNLKRVRGANRRPQCR